MSKNTIYVGRVSNINGSGFTATFGDPDENTYRGHFYKTAKAATVAALDKAAEAKMAEGVGYEIVGPFADQEILAGAKSRV